MNLLAVLLLASFSGKFQGTGKAVFKSGRVYECKEIFLNIKESATDFQLIEGGYRCGDLLNTSFDPYKFSIKNGELVYQGKVYGKISDKELSYSVYDPEDGSTYYLTLERSSDGIHYLEKWHDGEQIALTVEGKLGPFRP
jgi:hypothetical protein